MDNGRVLSAPGSREPSPDGLGPSGFDPSRVPFQARVDDWLLACFGEEIARDKTERNHRFLEEALELVQAGGCTASEAHQLVDYTFSRPVGEIGQEIGGVMNTLAALCLAYGRDMQADGDTEIARCWTKVEVIRAKQAAKPKHSPLPVAAITTALNLRDEARQKLRMVVSHATGGSSQDIDASVNDICVRITANRNHIYQEGKRTGGDEARSLALAGAIEACEQQRAIIGCYEGSSIDSAITGCIEAIRATEQGTSDV